MCHMVKTINGEEWYSKEGFSWEKLTNIHKPDSLPFRYIMHYVGHDARIGAGVNLLIDFAFDVARGVDGPEDAKNLLQQLGYTIEEIENDNQK